MEDRVGRQPQYDVFADEFLAHARDGLYNAHYDRPACLDLLGDVAGRRVLDAACGPGLYAAELVRRGDVVTGFDQSPRMVEICRDAVPEGEFRVHDLADPIGWLPGGALVLSRQHPTSDWLRNGGSYFDVRVIHETWQRGWSVSYWLAPLQTTCQEIFEAGFLIERLVEPRPAVTGADRGDYERLNREPGFLAFRLVPRG
jgi:SAM-dependent methyltransferase